MSNDAYAEDAGVSLIRADARQARDEHLMGCNPGGEILAPSVKSTPIRPGFPGGTFERPVAAPWPRVARCVHG
jgi:hypothetical protein